MENEPTVNIQPGDSYSGWNVQEFVHGTFLSEVWRVSHFITGIDAALKVIAEGLVQDEYFLNKFKQEVNILQTIKHPNIPAALACFPVGNRYAVVTPWVEGWTLEKLIRANPQGLPLHDALSIAVDVLAALGHVHGHEIFHRDIKPLNIMVEYPSLKPHLIDFGIALVIGEPRRTSYGRVLGSPDYMSPEQIQRPREVDHRTDVYAFGCVLFEMLTGRPPFVSPIEKEIERLYDIQRQHLYDPAPPLRQFRPDLPIELEKVLQSVLEKDPDRRCPNCYEFRAELEYILGNGSGPAPVPPPDPAPDRPPQARPLPSAALVIGTPGTLALAVLATLAVPGPALVSADGGGLRPEALLTAGRLTLLACGALFSFAAYLWTIYRAWGSLPPMVSRTTPLRAVLLHFAFPYNLVAAYRLFPGFLTAYNEYVAAHQPDAPEYSEAPGLVWVAVPFLLPGAWYLLEGTEQAAIVAALLLFWMFAYAVLVYRVSEAVNSLSACLARSGKGEDRP